jgi:polysaccharide export outer membrane protein
MGCGNKFWDPTQMGRFRPVPAVNVILDSLGVADETPSTWEGTEDPRPIDVMDIETDHVFSPGDVVVVSIYELLRNGQWFTNQYPITETGRLSIPEVGIISAEGLTEAQLEEEIEDILRPDILREPSVTVILVQSQRRSYSVLGNGIVVPGKYFLPRYGIRLSEAIAIAGGVSEFNVSYIYVARAVTAEQVTAEMPQAPPKPVEPQRYRERLLVPSKQEMLEIITPQSVQSNRLGFNRADKLRMPVITSAEMATSDEAGSFKLNIPDFGSGGSDSRGRIEWIFRDGKWVPMRTQDSIPVIPPKTQIPRIPDILKPPEQDIPVDYGWDQIGTGGVEARVIRIPFEKFQSGDPRYNIMIRQGDSIYVPVDIIGEFYIMGNVNRSGAIQLTGRPMTLKMAIAAAGGLGPLAWPKRCEVIRRLGKDREETVMVDLDKVFRGEQPDIFVKINDTIIVGTHPTSMWRAVLRNSFRASYGFSFSYDRNFVYDEYYGTDDSFFDLFK